MVLPVDSRLPTDVISNAHGAGVRREVVRHAAEVDQTVNSVWRECEGGILDSDRKAVDLEMPISEINQGSYGALAVERKDVDVFEAVFYVREGRADRTYLRRVVLALLVDGAIAEPRQKGVLEGVTGHGIVLSLVSVFV